MRVLTSCGMFLIFVGMGLSKDLNGVSLVTLPNGLRLVLCPVPGNPLAAISVCIRSGAADEPAESNGVAHLMEHLVLRSASLSGSPQARLEALGGYVNAETGRDFTNFYAVLPSGKAKEGLKLLTEALSSPSFQAEVIQRERRIVELELEELKENPFFVCKRLVERGLYGTHPYARPMGGSHESLAKITPEKAQAFYQSHYGAGNISIVVVGGFEPDEIEPAVGEMLGSLREGKKPVPAPFLSKLPRLTEPLVAPAPGRVRVITLAFRAPGASQYKDFCTMNIIATYLGEGHTARLYEVLTRRETPLVASLNIEYLTQLQASALTITCGLKGADAGEVERAILKETERLKREPLEPRVLKRCQRLLEGAFYQRTATVLGLAKLLSEAEAMGSYQQALSYLDTVRSITPEDIQQVARTYLTADGYVVGILLPTNAVNRHEEVDG